MSLSCPDPDLCGRGCRYSRCHAASDGDCYWPECPQQIVYQGHCPLDICAFDDSRAQAERDRICAMLRSDVARATAVDAALQKIHRDRVNFDIWGPSIEAGLKALADLIETGASHDAG